VKNARSSKMLDEQALAFGAVLVEEFNPEEAELYPELIASYRSPEKAKKDHPLGSGLGEIVQAISPYFFEIGEAVIGGLWTIAQTTTEKSIEDSLTPKVTAWIGRKLAKPAPLALTAGQIDTIMETIETKVSRMRASKETKQKVLDRIRSALSEGRPDEGHRE
jgi:hypothetical protein